MQKLDDWQKLVSDLLRFCKDKNISESTTVSHTRVLIGSSNYKEAADYLRIIKQLYNDKKTNN